MILNILKSEASDDVQLDEDHKGYVFTTAPYDLVKLFNEAFQVVRVKKIKELMLKMLQVYQDITFQYQKALQKFFEMTTKKELPLDFLIAECNNFFLFW